VALKVVGSNPTTHPLVATISTITFFQKKKIKKKNNLVFKITTLSVWYSINIFNNIFNYKLYKKINSGSGAFSSSTNKHQMVVPVNLTITQNKHNPKALVSIHNRNLNTFSVGSVVKYFNIKQSKYVRRSLKGLKIFLNFLRSIFYKKYYLRGLKYLVFSISGFDYNLISCKKSIKYFIQVEAFKKIYFLYNLKISFTKKKDKRVKSIKKRLRKKILKNFLKKSNITNK
jgi:hypothetical protein